ncbi:MAG TPA: enoyl-CoA hydratase/isomerase family protein [Mycobacteriales bacterium]|nr:enoyl-CoA hydratase/isomerase family protein [Mycobacteriales bacterium]
MADAVLSEEKDGVLTLRLNRAEALNALSGELVAGLAAGVAGAAADDAVRVVVITGSGRAFCAGADLREARELVGDAAAFRGWLLEWRAAFDSFERCGKPVIAAVNGLALAGGLELALSCDLIVASDAAGIGDAHVRYGLVPGGGGSQRLPDAVGTRWARWLMYTGETLDAATAHRIGLVQQVFPAASFDADVAAMAATMARRSTAALAFMKRASRTRLVTDDGLDLEIEAAARVVTGPDAREGLAAFVEKREPRFAAADR